MELVNESKPGELTSLEEVISSLVKDMLDPEKDSPLDPEVRDPICVGYISPKDADIFMMLYCCRITRWLRQ